MKAAHSILCLAGVAAGVALMLFAAVGVAYFSEGEYRDAQAELRAFERRSAAVENSLFFQKR